MAVFRIEQYARERSQEATTTMPNTPQDPVKDAPREAMPPDGLPRSWTRFDLPRSETPLPALGGDGRSAPSPPAEADGPPGPDLPKTRVVVAMVLDRRFKILDRIASGGMADVYLCEDLALRSRAAVKILAVDDADIRRRFLDEAMILANLRLPQLVQVLAVGETDDGAPYMVMEHLGRSLAARLKDDGRVPWREAVAIAAQVGQALDLLHQAGVFHRDVKPSNIVELGGANGRALVKLIDLGIARVDDWAAVQGGGPMIAPRRPTGEGKVIGTEGFIAPEAGYVPPDARFDVFGLGVTLYKIITGVMPDPIEPAAMREVRPELEIPEELESLVARSIAALAERRPASMQELLRELAAIRTTHAELEAPALFDDCYELIEPLGVGAKAEVHRAYHRDARVFVALKLLHEEIAGDDEERARFDREARVLSALSHPAIPRLVECRTGAQRRRPFIAMTLQPGRPVGDFLSRRLEADEVAIVGEILASALEHMHAHGVIHRDLNRSNVLIDLDEARGGAPRASIVDFGQVELLQRFWAHVDGERYPTPPEARARLGTGGLEHLAWTAPEARANKVWSGKSDVYSLGLLLYLLLTGKQPTKDEHGEVLSPATIVPESRGPLADAILAALQEEPQQRLDAAGLRARFADIMEEIREIKAAEVIDEQPSGESEVAGGSLSSRSGSNAGVDLGGPSPVRAPPPRSAAPSILLSPLVGPRRWLLVPATAAVLVLGIWIGQRAGPGASAEPSSPLSGQTVPDPIRAAPDDVEAECPIDEATDEAPSIPTGPADVVDRSDREEIQARSPIEARPSTTAKRTRSPSPGPATNTSRDAQLAGEAPELALCLPPSAGAVDLTIEVAADGSIGELSLSDPGLGGAVKKCMKRQLRARHLGLAAGPSKHHLPLRRAP